MAKRASRNPDKSCQNAQMVLVVILACGATVEQAAKQTGLSERTIYRRLADPEFARRLQEVRSEMLQRTSGTLTATGSEAVRTLVTLLNPNVAPNVRLGAARAVLEIAIKIREAADLEHRILDLEAKINSMSQGPKLRIVPEEGESTPAPGEPAAGPTGFPNDPAPELRIPG